MYSKNVLIKNPTGLHARPATKLVNLTKKFKSDLELINGDITVDPKSILSMLAGELRPGTEIVVRADGEDETAAVEEICKFIDTLEE